MTRKNEILQPHKRDSGITKLATSTKIEWGLNCKTNAKAMLKANKHKHGAKPRTRFIRSAMPAASRGVIAARTWLIMIRDVMKFGRHGLKASGSATS